MDYLLLGGLLLAALVWLLAPWVKRQLAARREKPVEPESTSAGETTQPASRPRSRQAGDSVATRPQGFGDEADTEAGGPDTEQMQRPAEPVEAAEPPELTEDEADALLKRLQEAAMLDAQERAAEEKATRQAELQRLAEEKARQEAAQAQAQALRDEAIQRARQAADDKAKAAAALAQEEQQRKAQELAARARELEALALQQRAAEERARQEEQARLEEQERSRQAERKRAEEAERQARRLAEQQAAAQAEQERQALLEERQRQARQQEEEALRQRRLEEQEEAAAAARALADRPAPEKAEAEQAAAGRAPQSEGQARRAAQEAAARPEPAPPGPGPASPRLPEHTLVMVADDSKVVRVKASRLLAKHQYQVLLAEDGADAARQILERAPDLLITDVEMPGMDGFELTRHVRQDPRTAHIPVIMITAADDRHRDAAQDAGVNVLLGKPYEDEELIARIESTLNPG